MIEVCRTDSLASSLLPADEPLGAAIRETCRDRPRRCDPPAAGVPGDRIHEILALIGDQPTLDAGAKAWARNLYAALKATLREDMHAGATIRGRLALTETEKRYFRPAVAAASATLAAATNTDPIRGNWHSQLSSARIDIIHALRILEAPAG